MFNDQDELLECVLTPGNVDEPSPLLQMVQRLFGKLFGDKGFLPKKLQEELRQTFRLMTEVTLVKKLAMGNALKQKSPR